MECFAVDRKIFLLVFIAGFSLSCSGTGRAVKGAYSEPGSPRNIVVCFGDSVTLGVGKDNWEGFFRSRAYPAFLGKKVKIPVINAGVAGDTTEDALGRLNNDVLSRNPRVVIVFLGINDFLDGERISKMEQNYSSILEGLNAKERKIFIVRFFSKDIFWDIIENWNMTDDEKRDYIERYNLMFGRLESNYNVDIIDDVWKGVWKTNMSDHIHPNREGYKVMADNILSSIKPYLEINGFLK